MAIVTNNEKQFDIEEIIWHTDPVTREELYQVIVFSTGTGHIQLDFETYEVVSPALLFVSEFQLFTTLEGNNVQGKVIQFSNDFFCIKLNRAETFCDAVIFNSTQAPIVQLTEKENNKLHFLLDSLQDELSAPSIYQEAIITSQLKTSRMRHFLLGQIVHTFEREDQASFNSSHQSSPELSMKYFTSLCLLLLTVSFGFTQTDTTQPPTPEQLVQQQLDGYNARDIDAFLVPYSEEVEIYNFPNELSNKGKDNIRPGYASMFEKWPKLHCELVNRMVLGNTVIDHERITGVGPEPFEAIAVYTIENHKIAKVHFIRKE